MKLKTFYLLIGLLVISGSLSACGGKRAKAEKNTEQVATGDITQPPSVVKEVVEPEAERDGTETISYDEWRKKREIQALPSSSDDE